MNGIDWLVAPSGTRVLEASDLIGLDATARELFTTACPVDGSTIAWDAQLTRDGELIAHDGACEAARHTFTIFND